MTNDAAERPGLLAGGQRELPYRPPEQKPARPGLFAGGWRELTHRPPGQEPALDAFRAFAVLAVICTHYALPEWPRVGLALPRIGSTAPFFYGWTGVDLFFVLSGLLIGRQLWREIDRDGTVRIGRFLLRRGLRIWPLYFVAMAYVSLTAATAWPDWTFLSNYVGGKFSRSWSLATEEQFYIIVPIMLVISARVLTLRKQLWLLLALLVSVPIVRVVTRAHLVALGTPAQRLADKMQYPIHLHCEPLLIGLLLALLATTRPEWFQAKAAGQFASRAFAVMLVMCVTGVALDWYDKGTFAFLALGLIFGGATYFGMVDRSLLTRPLHAWAFYPISRLSYGMYLNHFVVFPGSTAWVVRHGGGLPTTVVFLGGLLLAVVISISVAIVTFLLVEQPFLQLRARLLAGRRQRVAAPVLETAL
jgi:peptidoglycan/LPS O-acetylase OafA/YrhL